MVKSCGRHYDRVPMSNRVMIYRISRHITCLMILLSIATCYAEPEPLPGMIFTENFADDTENYMLLQRLKQMAELNREIMEDEQELTEAQYEIQAMLEAKARKDSAEQAEMLPVPSAVTYHGPMNSGKRTSYMALCHFKICNMGRKRQLRADFNGKL